MFNIILSKIICINSILGLQSVEQLICDQIHENHDELCNQVTWIENLESIINEISLQIQVNISVNLF